MTQELTQQRLRQLLSYDKSTGKFSWRIFGTNQICPGMPAGAVSRGYVRIRIEGKYYAAHRLAWLYVYGKLPEYEIDHINRDRLDNRIENLRDVPHFENCQNQGAKKNSILGVKGVSKVRNKYTAKISILGKIIRLGTFDTLEEAKAKYDTAAQILHAGAPS